MSRFIGNSLNPKYLQANTERSQQWQKDNPERFKQSMNKYRHNLKIEVYSPINMPCCSLCGNTNINVLALNHMNNDGNKDTRKGISLYNHALSIKDKSQFQTLCYNCNWKKHIVNLKNKNSKNPRHKYQHNYNLSLKQQCISHYSNNQCKCFICSENDVDVLCLDHIENNGAKHRASVALGGKIMYLWTIKNNFPPMFQVLCMNCNINKQRKKK